ncbi:MAG TPA: hypothetical protein DIT64_00690 [Verrucomicrobiales bacterium]|nr:hypothetical protein [Verrucomicrobiales bacterium]HCN77914.1 hypothetical protein [Verrucomicrobiales bacterium]HRJ07033.1 hypothetical protein [Prosthecobacter sp.]HRK12946.1 hypothetical protein [Prosthecobacter sp.]
MKNRLFISLASLPILVAAQNADPDLPQAFDPKSVAPVLESSPFSRMVNLSDNLVLTGIAYVDGKPVATIFNKETKQSSVVGSEPNFQGWILQEALPAPDVKLSQAKISIGGEVVSVRYATVSAEEMRGERRRDGERGGPPPPGGEGDRFRGPSRGPSEEDRRRYEALSEKGKEKLRDMMRSKFSDEKFRNAPEEERRNIIRREVERIEKEDQGGR